MEKQHGNELLQLILEIYEYVADRLGNYISTKYCGIGNVTTEKQIEDYLFVAEGVSAYLLGNALALMDPNFQETEIKSFAEDLRKVIVFAQKNTSCGQLPS
jgi:hypothetical protein